MKITSRLCELPDCNPQCIVYEFDGSNRRVMHPRDPGLASGRVEYRLQVYDDTGFWLHDNTIEDESKAMLWLVGKGEV